MVTSRLEWASEFLTHTGLQGSLSQPFTSAHISTQASNQGKALLRKVLWASLSAASKTKELTPSPLNTIATDQSHCSVFGHTKWFTSTGKFTTFSLWPVSCFFQSNFVLSPVPKNLHNMAIVLRQGHSLTSDLWKGHHFLHHVERSLWLTNGRTMLDFYLCFLHVLETFLFLGGHLIFLFLPFTIFSIHNIFRVGNGDWTIVLHSKLNMPLQPSALLLSALGLEK